MGSVTGPVDTGFWTTKRVDRDKANFAGIMGFYAMGL